MTIKKILVACGLGLCLISGSVISSASRSAMAAEHDTKAIRVMGIVNNISGNSLESKKKISREEFSKMLIHFTNETGMVKAASKKNLYKDVKKDHKYRGYINAAGMKGYMRGYASGNFAYKKAVSLHMAAYSSLKLLGYSDAELLPLGEAELMQRFNSLQLNKNIHKQAGDKLSGKDCVELFSNLLYAPKKDGVILGRSLGYQFNQDGSLDSYSVIAGRTEICIADRSGASALKGKKVGSVYRNDKRSDIQAIEKFDLLYYNAEDKTLYAYSDRVYGQLTDIQPSVSAAKVVVIAGKSYELTESPFNAGEGEGISGLNPWREHFNKQGIETGSFVIGIKDLNGKITALYEQKLSEDKIVGYVLGNEIKKIGDQKGGFEIVNMMILATTTGARMEIPNPNIAIGVGNIVRVTYDLTGKPVTVLENSSGGSLNGKAHLLSDELRAIEVSNDDYASVLPGAVKDLDLTKVQAEYIGYNAKGEITDLILKDALGAVYKYGIITDHLGSSISYLNKGTEIFSAYDSGMYFDPGRFAVALGFKEGKLNTVKNLEEIRLSRIDKNMAFSESGSKYRIADDVDVYYKSFGNWKYDSFKDMQNITGHVVKGYYLGNSNVIRILIIEK